MKEGTMFKPALIGGVLLGILSAIPVIGLVNCFCCAWVIGGGILAAHLYVKESRIPVTLGQGIGLGLLTGAIGGIVDTLLSIPLQFLLRGLGADVFEQLQEALESVPNMPPETKEVLRTIFSDSSGLNLILIFAGGIFIIITYAVMAMIGGAIGVAMFEKRKPGPPSPVGFEPAPPPPIPPADQA